MEPKYVTIRLDGGLGSASRARDVVRGVLRDQEDAFTDTAVLLTDEVVTNALVHGRSPHSASFDLDDERLRVSVSDSDAAEPLPVTASETTGDTTRRGRALMIVDALAARWGARWSGRVKDVWFELALPRPAKGGP